MGRIIVLLFIAFNLHATDTNEEKLFLYLHHKAHLKDKNEPHHKIESHLNAFKRVFSKGRIDIYELKKGMNFPLEMTDLLRPIKKGDWKVIPPELLTEKLNSEPEIIELIKKLDTSRVRYHLEYASGQASRRSGAPGNQELTAYILDYLKKLNYEMKKDCFSPGLCNVFGYKKGEIDEYVLINSYKLILYSLLYIGLNPSLIPLDLISLPNLFLFNIWSDNKRINSNFFNCIFNFSATS